MTFARRLVANDGSDLPAAVAELVARLACRGGLGAPAAYRLRLAADEITTNIAHHGYRGEPGAVELTGGVTRAGVWLRIEDEAPPFDPTAHPRHRAEPVGSAVGGFGLWLASAVVDGLDYARVRGRNRNVLVLHHPPRARLADHGRCDS